MARKRKSESGMEKNEFFIRLGISAIIIVVTCLVFFLGGGMNMFKSYAPKEVVYSDNFEIHFIDVGQGDSTLVRFPDGKTMLVDCGEEKESSGLVKYLTEVFNVHKVQAIDYLVLTHQDADHVGGAKAVLDAFQINMVYRPMQLSDYDLEAGYPNTNNYAVSDTKTYYETIKAVYNEPNCERKFIQAGLQIPGTNYSVDFLTPLSVSATLENNNYSPLMMIKYNGAKFLLTGDAESKVETQAVNKYGEELKADVYKVGHHGSNTSSSAKFLEEVKPKYAVVSAGKNNKYGHPTKKVLDRLNNVGAEVLTTIDLGTIIMSVDENGKVVILSHDTPNYDMTIVIAVGILLLLLTWGLMRNRKDGNKENKAKTTEKEVKKALKTVQKLKK